MSTWYLDTSAALKLIVEECESDALARSIDDAEADLVAGWLLETELRRTAHRDEAVSQTLVTNFLRGVGLYEMPASIYRDAGLLPGQHLRSLDALHLATAVRLGVDQVVTYDSRMSRAARMLGIDVASPGRSAEGDSPRSAGSSYRRSQPGVATSPD